MQYRDHDYTSGQLLLTLRDAIGLTQARLANHIGVSRRAVAEWETGKSYPKPEHLKTFIDLGIKSGAFRNLIEEVRALWKATRQKTLLDEWWLVGLPKEQPITYDQQMAAWYAYLEQRACKMNKLEERCIY